MDAPLLPTLPSPPQKSRLRLECSQPNTYLVWSDPVRHQRSAESCSVVGKHSERIRAAVLELVMIHPAPGGLVGHEVPGDTADSRPVTCLRRLDHEPYDRPVFRSICRSRPLQPQISRGRMAR